MSSIDEAFAQFKAISTELMAVLHEHLADYLSVLPDGRQREVLPHLVSGMLAARSPQVTKAAAHAPLYAGQPHNLAKRSYRLLHSPGYQHRHLLSAMQADARRQVQASGLERALVAVDPVNFEKRYTEKLEGVSQVYKATPPGLDGQGRITSGYPALVAQVVNLPCPAVSYAEWFSYTTADFLSENMHLQRAIRQTRQQLNDVAVCFVADRGLDDHKLFAYIDEQGAEFIIRAAHDRLIAVYNDHLDRWEGDEHLLDLAEAMAGRVCRKLVFSHAGQQRLSYTTLDWFQAHLIHHQQTWWVVIARSHLFAQPVVLWTNRVVSTAEDALAVFADWTQRPAIEHLYRFLQEDGLLVEDIQLHKLEQMRRLFLLVLAAALFVLRLPDLWSPAGVLWLRQLASSTAGLPQDRDGPYLLLLGLAQFFSTLATIEAARRASFLPKPGFG